MVERDLELRPIGRVVSPLTDAATAPRQGDEGAPDAYLVLDTAVVEALDGTPILDIRPVL
jgi:tRNA (Thr-GGU) A37 N-methylase